MNKKYFPVIICIIWFAFMFVFSGVHQYASASTDIPAAEEVGSKHPPTMQEEMLNYINTARAEAGLSPLYFDPQLVNGAYLKNMDMVDNCYFSHISPTYGSPLDMMKGLGIDYNIMGENLAKNFRVKGAFNAFMNSPHHRANLLNPEFTSAGFAFYQAQDYLYVTEWFTG